jgi:hypothetical protein
MNASYYKKIDSLRKKFDNNKPLAINEFCWIQWAEYGVCSAQYLEFKPWLRQNGVKEFINKKVKFNIWDGLFTSFVKDYNKQREGIPSKVLRV